VDLDALRATPEAFAAALDQLGMQRFTEPPAPGEWSPAEILTHVRAADTVIAPRVTQVLARPGVILPDLDERAVGDLLARVAPTPEEAVVAFRHRRSDLVALLMTLSDAEQALTGEHETRGRVTVDDIVRALVDHEREHLAQLDAAVQALDG
jgi:hypothetical protein